MWRGLRSSAWPYMTFTVWPHALSSVMSCRGLLSVLGPLAYLPSHMLGYLYMLLAMLQGDSFYLMYMDYPQWHFMLSTLLLFTGLPLWTLDSVPVCLWPYLRLSTIRMLSFPRAFFSLLCRTLGLPHAILCPSGFH